MISWTRRLVSYFRYRPNYFACYVVHTGYGFQMLYCFTLKLLSLQLFQLLATFSSLTVHWNDSAYQENVFHLSIVGLRNIPRINCFRSRTYPEAKSQLHRTCLTRVLNLYSECHRSRQLHYNIVNIRLSLEVWNKLKNRTRKYAGRKPGMPQPECHSCLKSDLGTQNRPHPGFFVKQIHVLA